MEITKHKLSGVLLAVFIIFFQIIILIPSKNVEAKTLWENQEGKAEISSAFGETNPENPVDIRVIVANVIKIFLGFMGAVFLVLNIMAGFKWMTAGGNEQAVTDAKSQLSRAAIGLAIILIAFSITYFVSERLVQGSTDSIW